MMSKFPAPIGNVFLRPRLWCRLCLKLPMRHNPKNRVIMSDNERFHSRYASYSQSIVHAVQDPQALHEGISANTYASSRMPSYQR